MVEYVDNTGSRTCHLSSHFCMLCCLFCGAGFARSGLSSSSRPRVMVERSVVIESEFFFLFTGRMIEAGRVETVDVGET